jgi:hypothetical protein
MSGRSHTCNQNVVDARTAITTAMTHGHRGDSCVVAVAVAEAVVEVDPTGAAEDGGGPPALPAGTALGTVELPAGG